MIATNRQQISEGPDEFTDSDGTWQWVGDFSPSMRRSVQDWVSAKNAPPLGRAIETRRRATGGVGPPRLYVSKEDMAEIRKAQRTEKDDPRWLTRPQAFATYGMTVAFLRTYSGDEGKPHPLIGKKIATDRRYFPKGKGAWKVVYFRRDLADLCKQIRRKPRPEKGTWATPAEAVATIGYAVDGSTLRYWHDHGCIYLSGAKLGACREWALRKNGRLLQRWYYRRDHLSRIAEKLGHHGERVFLDAHGRWLPGREAAEAIGVEPLWLARYHDEPIPELGRPIHHQRVRLTLYRSKHTLAFVYLEHDLATIQARRNGWPDPPAEREKVQRVHVVNPIDVANLDELRIAGDDAAPLKPAEFCRLSGMSASAVSKKYPGGSGLTVGVARRVRASNDGRRGERPEDPEAIKRALASAEKEQTKRRQ